MRRDLKNTGLPLLPTDVSNNLLDVSSAYHVNLRHIAELPMMGSDPDSRSALKRGIAVVIGFIDFMDQRGALLCALTSLAMAA